MDGHAPPTRQRLRALDRVPRFAWHIRPEPDGDDRLFLLAETRRVLLPGAVHALLGRTIDGQRTVRAIVDALEQHISPPEILFAIDSLYERGYLVDSDPAGAALSPEAAAFWHALGVTPAHAAARLHDCAVTVMALGDMDPGPLEAALAHAGVATRPAAGGATGSASGITVVVTDDYLAAPLAELNRQVLGRAGNLAGPAAAWMPIKPTGVMPWMGPVFVPGRGPCWACLAERLRHNQPVETFLARRRGVPSLAVPRAGLGATHRAALELAAVALARWIVVDRHGETTNVPVAAGALDRALLALDFETQRFTEHAVTRLPRCPECGDPAPPRTPWVLSPRPKLATDDGGHRILPAAQALERIEPNISPITGIVSSVGPVPGAQGPVHAAAYRLCPPAPGAGELADPGPAALEFDQRSMGKGRTEAQARMSALAEAIERHSAMFRGDEPLIRARRAELGARAMNPALLEGFSHSQHQRAHDPRRSDRTGRDPAAFMTVLPWRDDAEIHWTPAWSLTHGQDRYVPASHCYLRMPVPPGERFFVATSNGLAAGLCREEAVVQGFLELVERDATATWWYNRVPRPAVDLGSFGDPYFTDVQARYSALGWDVWALDLTHDLGIPCIAALAQQRSKGRTSAGFGCHPDARLAVQRALTELHQLFDPDRPERDPWNARDIEDPGYLVPDPGQSPRTRRDLDAAGWWHDDLADDVRTCVARAERAGLETLVVDHTRPDTGLCVVRVLVPGLRHVWPRLAPGRLYDVPVALGWRKFPRAEAELNPVPLLI